MSLHRLFIALRPPAAICDALLDPMEALAGARWQDYDNLHLTLRFAGEVSRHTADDLALALSRVEVRPFPLAIRGVGYFEKKGMANAIWAQVAASAELAALQERVEHACRSAGLAAETRKFVPHITLARLNRSSAPIAPWLARHAQLAPGPWQVDALGLYESRLTPSGPVYTQIAQFPEQSS